MKVLMISTDKKIFEDGSDVRDRMIEYGKLFDELNIIIFTPRGFKMKQIAENISVYPTNSQNRFFYVFDAVKIGKQIIKNLKLKIKNLQNDLIISCQDPFEAGFSGWLLTRKFKIKLQLQIHTDFLSPYFKKESILNRIRVLMARFLIPRADCVRVVSKRIKNLVSSKFKIQDSKLQILPIFVDIEKIKNTIVTVNLRKKYPQFEKIILMVSRLEKEKNISLAISAMKEVIKKHPKTGLVIVGEGSERKNLKSRVSAFKLDGNVIFDGWQNKETIFSYYKTADLFLITSYYEGYGMTIIEALAAGLPTLSTDVGIAREAGAMLTQRNFVAENIVKYIENNIKTAELRNYPYKNKQNYLEKFKESFICAS